MTTDLRKVLLELVKAIKDYGFKTKTQHGWERRIAIALRNAERALSLVKPE